MSLADLIAQRSSSTPLEEVPVEAPGAASSPVEADPAAGASSSGDEPYGVSQVVTPKGIEIYYQAGPKRLYRLREVKTPEHDGDTGYETEWFEVPSMSEILGILDKPGLPWWGMKIGVQGLSELVNNDHGDRVFDALHLGDIDTLIELLTKKKLTVNHVRDKAGDRGQDIHDALELWADKGIIPNPDVFGPDKRGYVEGLRQFVIDSGFEPQRSEVMVGSIQHKFAGRFDLGGLMPNGARVVVKSYPKRKAKVEPLPGGDWMLDLKTSKGVYVTHHLQLRGYNLAVEEGYGQSYDHLGVIHVFEDGRYELVQVKAQNEHFLAVKGAYDALAELK